MTSGLKRVTADMKSKNRLDKTGVVPASASASPAPVKATPQGEESITESQCAAELEDVLLSLA